MPSMEGDENNYENYHGDHDTYDVLEEIEYQQEIEETISCSDKIDIKWVKFDNF